MVSAIIVLGRVSIRGAPALHSLSPLVLIAPYGPSGRHSLLALRGGFDPPLRRGVFGGTLVLIGLTGLLTLAGCGDDAAAPPAPPAVSPAVVDAALVSVEEYLLGEDLVRAEAVTRTLIDRASDEPRAREMLARILMARALDVPGRDSPEAVELFGQSYEQYRIASDLDPKYHRSAGNIAVMAGDDEAALDHFLRAAEHDRLDPQPPLFAAQLLIKAERHEEAITQLERALVIDPDLPYAHASLAAIAMNRDDFDEARRRIGLARDIDGADIELRVQEARIHRRGGEPGRALELLVTLGDADRARATVTAEISAAYAALDRHADAARAWSHRYGSSSLRPDDPTVWRCAVRAAEQWLEAGDRMKARLWLDQAKLLAPESPEVLALEQRLSADG
jgi:tetratricopeptide (TPR) repeat protein